MAVVIVCDACGRAYHVSPDSGVTEIPCSCGRLLPVPGAVPEKVRPPEEAPPDESAGAAEAVSAEPEAPPEPAAAIPLVAPTRLPRALWVAAGVGLVLGALTSFAGELRIELWTVRLPGVTPWAWFVAPGAGVVVVWLLALRRRLDGMAAAGGVVAGLLAGIVLMLVVHSLGFAWRVILRIFHDAIDWRVFWALICALTAPAAGAAAVGLEPWLARLAQGRTPRDRRTVRIVAAVIGGAGAAGAFAATRLLPASGSGGGWVEAPVVVGLTLLTAIIGATVAMAALDVGVKHEAGSTPYLLAVLGMAAGSILEAMLGYSGVPMLVCLVALPLAGGLAGMAAGVGLAAGGMARQVALAALAIAGIVLVVGGTIYYPSPEAIVVRMLIQQARDRGGERQAEALAQIKQTTDPSALRPLLAGLRGEDDVTAAACADALGRIGDPRAVKGLGRALLHEEILVRRAAVAALARIGTPSAVEKLLAALRSSDEEIARYAARVLSVIPEHALEPLLEMARGDDAALRKWAMRALGGMEQSPQATQALVAALSDPEAEVRSAAVAGLGSPEQAETYDQVVKLLSDADPEVRRQAARSLGRMQDPRAPAVLAPLLRDADEQVADGAARALGEIGSDAAVAALAQALHDPRDGVVRAAAQALNEAGGRAATRALLDLVRRDAGPELYSSVYVNYLLNMDDIAVEELAPLLTDPDGRMRQAAETALWGAGERAFPAVIPFLSHEDADVRAAAAKILVSREEKPDPAIFLPLLLDEDARVRECAARGLGGQRAVGTLVKALDHDDARIAAAAARLLGRQQSPAIFDSLMKALRSERIPVAQAAAEALGGLGDARAVDALLEVLRGGREALRPQAAVALGLLGDARALDPLLEALAGPDPEMRLRAAQGLGGLADAGAIDGLIDALSDTSRDVRRAAARALSSVGEPAIEPLEKLVNSEDDWVCKGARIALIGMQNPRATAIVDRAQPREMDLDWLFDLEQERLQQQQQQLGQPLPPGVHITPGQPPAQSQQTPSGPQGPLGHVSH